MCFRVSGLNGDRHNLDLRNLTTSALIFCNMKGVLARGGSSQTWQDLDVLTAHSNMHFIKKKACFHQI